jgi:hypothetical protein
MNDEDRSIIIQSENHLKQAATPPGAPNQTLVVFNDTGKRPAGSGHNQLCFLRRDAVLLNVVFVPLVPAEIHA